ncbi:hypothetical protein HR45_09080 [Shewanella mangrovi]|uniref:ABC-type glycine betaine transport system substrate-binding domain-containing protein n=1 Tax=Shewanella mangrovi TaxID=1515746 RepID=A0A094JCC5_9GAMM|nr:glycine betaine ABC transporter substrate-binding protein [Shewanella mangrovi]KFZ37570.1 hypothetical protein HR45_09080 [Shewanella mangrovi]
MLMFVAIGLWMLYPPVVNYLVDKTSVFYVAAVAHSFAAVCTLLCVAVMLFHQRRALAKAVLTRDNLRKLSLPTLFSGILICANHLLLYAALSRSKDFDVIAILVFETWPILFFYIDSALRRNKRKIALSDYVFSGAAFAGFLVLTAPNIDMADWLLLDSPMLQTIGLAALGGLAMAVNCYFRMRCMDNWTAISANNGLNLSHFRCGLLTEAGVRTVAAPLLIMAFVLSGNEVPAVSGSSFLLLLFVGVAILALGSLLYDLSVFLSSNASISALWYLMPVGAVVILAVMQGRLLNQYEAVASVLIVSSNIFLGLRYPLRSSMLFLFVAVCSIGLWILFMPTAAINSYYDLLAVSTVFFVLLATFALDRTASLNREREGLLGDFSEQVIGVLEAQGNSASEQQYSSNIKQYVLGNLHSFLRAFKNLRQLAGNQQHLEQLKYEMLPQVKQDDGKRQQLLELFKIGDKLMTIESDRISPEEFVILILLGGTNVFFSLVFRPPTLSTGLFALIVGAAVIYLLLIIFERDKYVRIRHDHALVCRNLLSYLKPHPVAEAQQPQVSQTEQDIERVLNTRAGSVQNRSTAYWVFGVFAFLFVGFGYGFLFESLQQQRSYESSPLVASNSKPAPHEIHIALLDWPSAQIKSHILAEIINQHTELKASVVSMANEQVFRAMDEKDGIVDVHPDLWVENNSELIRRYVRAFGTVTLGEQASQAEQGLCYTDIGLPKQQSSLSYTQLLSKETAQKFDLDGDGLGDIWVGGQGWASVAIEKRRLAAYGLDKQYRFHVFDTDVMQMLLQRNNRQQLSSLFFCYYPDAVFRDQHVHFVQDKAFNKAAWAQIKQPPKDKLKSLGGSAWPNTEIRVAYRSSLAQQSDEVIKLLNHFQISNQQLVNMLAKMQSGQTAQQLAKQWVETHQDKVLSWLTGFELVSPSANITADEPSHGNPQDATGALQ